MIYFVTNKRPLSYNSKKSKYQNQLRGEYDRYFKHLYAGIPLSGDLSIRIFYGVYKEKAG